MSTSKLSADTTNRFRIAHLADIHVKDRRREEYAAVFAKLAVSLREATPDMIAIAGDVFDSMTRASTNNVMDVAALLEVLTGIAPVAIIPGNHDVNMYSDEKAALLDTILKAGGGARRLDNVHYWPNSGVHRLDINGRSVVWVAAPPKHPLPSLATVKEALESCGSGAAVVGLFHETVGGACFDNGMQAAEGSPLSKGYLAALAAVSAAAAAPCALLLGDIHLRQEVEFAGSGSAAAAWYPGSLVCQGFGENHRGHGWLQWDVSIDGLAVTPVEVANPRAHLTITLERGEDVTVNPRPEHPQAVRLRHCAATTPAQIREAVAAAEAQYGMPLRSVGPGPQPRAAPGQQVVEHKGLEAANRAADSWERHTEFIRDRLAKTAAAELMTPGTTEAVIERHRVNMERLMGGERRRPRVELLRLEFDNLYCYGKGNVVDFAALRAGRPGLGGVVADNRAGKSALFDILTFAFCDAPSRGTKQDLTRRGADSYSLKLEFALDGVLGRIEKSGRGHQARGHHTIRFWMGGEELTESTTPQTAQQIRSYVGSLADIEAVVLVRPASVTGRQPFAAQTPETRRSTVSGLLRLGVFADLKKGVDAEAAELRAEFRGATAGFRGQAPGKKQAPHTVLTALEAHVANLESDVAVAEKTTSAAAEIRTTARAAHVTASEAAAGARAKRELALSTVERLADGAAASVDNLEGWRDAKVAVTTMGDVETARTQLAVAQQAITTAATARAEKRAQRATHVAIWEAAGSPAALPEEEVVALEAATANDPSARWLADRDRAAARVDQKRVDTVKAALADARSAVTAKTAAIAAEPEPATVNQAKFEEVLRLSTSADDLALMQENLARLTARARTVFSQPTPVTPLEATRAAERVQVLEAKRAQINRLIDNAGIDLNAAATDFKSEGMPSLDVQLQTLAVDMATHARKQSETKAQQAIASQVLTMTRKTRGKCQGCQHVTRYLGGNAAQATGTGVIAARCVNALRNLDESLETLKAKIEDGTSEAERLAAATELTAAKDKVKMASRVTAVLDASRAKIAAHRAWHASRAAMHQLVAAEETHEMVIASQRELARAELGLETALEAEVAAKTARAALECTAGGEDADADINSEVLRLEALLVATERRFNGTRLKFQAGAALDALTVADNAVCEAGTAADELADAESAWATATETLHAARAVLGQLGSSVETVRALVARLDTAEAYRKVLDSRNGLGALLLEEARPAIGSAINQALAGLAASFRIVIAPGFELELVDNETKSTTVPALGSGYQQFALDLAVRIALAAVAQVPLPACFLIDEGFGCLDAANLARVGEALASQATAPGAPLTLAVTHREDLRSHFVHLITIDAPVGGPSKVVWPVNAAPELDLAAPPHVTLDEPSDDDTHHCALCDASVSPSRVAAHAETKVHTRNQRLADAADAIVAGFDCATRVGLKVRCDICARTFTAKMWSRHVASKRHLEEAKR